MLRETQRHRLRGRDREIKSQREMEMNGQRESEILRETERDKGIKRREKQRQRQRRQKYRRRGSQSWETARSLRRGPEDRRERLGATRARARRGCQGRRAPPREPGGSGFCERTRVWRLSVPGRLTLSETQVCHGAGHRHQLCFCHWACLCVWFGVSGCVCVGCVGVFPGTSVRVSFSCGWRVRVPA